MARYAVDSSLFLSKSISNQHLRGISCTWRNREQFAIQKYEISNNHKSEANHQVFMSLWSYLHLLLNSRECNIRTVKLCETKNLFWWFRNSDFGRWKLFFWKRSRFFFHLKHFMSSTLHFPSPYRVKSIMSYRIELLKLYVLKLKTAVTQ